MLRFEVLGKEVVFVIAEAALELVPPEIAGHSAVSRNARRRGKSPVETLLDVSLHYPAMKRLRDREKRGRPDILHVTLLELLSSPLNLEGLMKIYVHTYGDYAITVDPSTKVPRNYMRFVGLMEQLLTVGRVPPNSDKPLMKAYPSTFRNLLKEAGFESCILLSEEGDLKPPEEICGEALNSDLPLVIGGFPHGKFNEEVSGICRSTFSIYHRPLEAWVVASRLAGACEKVLKVLI
ncbi:MAG: 16S rRNA methyltransferase [Desulfurococcales archaeon]|nr:16S rRNA methyltransferase [Desulfurococcales archaeon]